MAEGGGVHSLLHQVPASLPLTLTSCTSPQSRGCGCCCRGKAGRAGAGQAGEEKAAGRAESSCQCLEGLRESWRGSGPRAWGDGTRGAGFRLKEGRFR